MKCTHSLATHDGKGVVLIGNGILSVYDDVSQNYSGNYKFGTKRVRYQRRYSDDKFMRLSKADRPCVFKNDDSLRYFMFDDNKFAIYRHDAIDYRVSTVEESYLVYTNKNFFQSNITSLTFLMQNSMCLSLPGTNGMYLCGFTYLSAFVSLVHSGEKFFGNFCNSKK